MREVKALSGKSICMFLGTIVGISILLTILAIFLANYYGWFGYDNFFQKHTIAQRTAYHNSSEYINVKINELDYLERMYIVATPSEQAKLRSVILTEFYHYRGPLPGYLEMFLYSIGQTELDDLSKNSEK